MGFFWHWQLNWTTHSLILLYHISFISQVSNVATILVVGQPITNDLSAGMVVSDTSSKQELDSQISQMRIRFLSLNVVLDLQTEGILW